MDQLNKKKKDNGYSHEKYLGNKDKYIQRANGWRKNNPERYREIRKGIRKRAKYKPENWITTRYSGMRNRNIKRFGCELSFTKEQFREWVLVQNKNLFEHLFNEYVKSDFDKNKCPSIDRIDDYKGYSFDNITLVTWEMNNLRGRSSSKNKDQCSKMAKRVWSKPVLQLSVSGNIVAEYPSTREAARQNGGFNHSAISAVCRGEKKTHKGYGWKYRNEVMMSG